MPLLKSASRRRLRPHKMQAIPAGSASSLNAITGSCNSFYYLTSHNYTPLMLRPLAASIAISSSPSTEHRNYFLFYPWTDSMQQHFRSTIFGNTSQQQCSSPPFSTSTVRFAIRGIEFVGAFSSIRPTARDANSGHTPNPVAGVLLRLGQSRLRSSIEMHAKSTVQQLSWSFMYLSAAYILQWLKNELLGMGR